MLVDERNQRMSDELIEMRGRVGELEGVNVGLVEEVKATPNLPVLGQDIPESPA